MSTITEEFVKRRGLCLFRFHDGTSERKVDAWKIVQALREEVPLETIHANSGSAADLKPVVDSLRRLLRVPEFDEDEETGLMDSEMLKLASEFLDFVEGQKKSTAPQPTSPQFTEPQSLGQLHDACSLVCGSTYNGSRTA